MRLFISKSLPLGFRIGTCLGGGPSVKTSPAVAAAIVVAGAILVALVLPFLFMLTIGAVFVSIVAAAVFAPRRGRGGWGGWS